MVDKIGLKRKGTSSFSLFFAILFFLPCLCYANDIAVVQEYMHRVGQEVEVTGEMDEQTLNALVRYQASHYVEVTGEIDEPTVVRMFGSTTIPPDAYSGAGMEWFPIRLLHTAEQYIGVPYVWGGSSPEEGFDCSGFIQYVFHLCGVQLPRTADVQFERGYVIEKQNLLPGDLVFFETYEPGPSHVGIYYNQTYFLHADSVTGMIVFDTLERAYREETYLGARRMVLW